MKEDKKGGMEGEEEGRRAKMRGTKAKRHKGRVKKGM